MAISTYKVFLMAGTDVDTYTLSEDTTVKSKTYYTRTGTDPNYVYTPVAEPSGNPHTQNYYEKSTSTTWAKLVDIKDFPDLGGAPETLETTTLSDAIQTNILGIQSLDALEFTANYDVTDFQTLKALKGITAKYAVWFGGTGTGAGLTPTGSNGKFSFEGQLDVFPVGGGVNEVIDMTISIAASTEIEFAAS